MTAPAAEHPTPVWFITGCSTGFGRALSSAVIARGWNLVLTARNVADLDDLIAEAGDRAIALPLDVTDAEAIRTAVLAAELRFGRIDVLVNNAGYGYVSVIELADDAQVRAMFDTNFFGLVRLTQAVLPMMRARRQGHIINIGSIAGLISGASSAFYSASKHAVEAFTEALADECAAFGIRATVVEPGTFATDFTTRSLKRTQVTLPEYEDAVAAFLARPDKLISNRRPGAPARGAAAVIECAMMDEPPLRLPLGMDACPRITEALQKRLTKLEQWRGVAESAAFPSD